MESGSGQPAGPPAAGRAALKGRTREGSVLGLGAEFLLGMFSWAWSYSWVLEGLLNPRTAC